MVFLAEISDYSKEFFEKAALLLPPEKRSEIFNITNKRARNESVLAWTLLRFALAKNNITVIPPLSFSERGKPFFRDEKIFFNLSHSKEKVCVALSFRSEIGTDVQAESDFSDKMKKRVFCENELIVAEGTEKPYVAFTRLWAMKESYLKNTGSGIAFDLKSLDFSKPLLSESFESEGLYYCVFDLDGYALSVCSSEKEKQRLISVAADELSEFVMTAER